MNEKIHLTKLKQLLILLLGLFGVATVLIFVLLYLFTDPQKPQNQTKAEKIEAPLDDNQIENGLDVATGFVAEGDYMLVKATCTSCHSSKLVLQNRATREGWLEMIRWMQETQKLWDLGENEDKILNYLATHYAPEEQGRRVALKVEEWYEIK